MRRSAFRLLAGCLLLLPSLGYAGPRGGGVGEMRDGAGGRLGARPAGAYGEGRWGGRSQPNGDDGSHDTRNGGSVDVDKTTDGNTTTRDTTYTNENGDSAAHTGSVTKDDGNVDYSGSTTTGAGGSTTGRASGTYSNGQVDSMNTSLHGTNSAGESGTHDGNLNRDGDTVTYRGSSSTSTGRSSAATAAVTRTNDGVVARGAVVGNQGAAAGTVVRDGNQVYGHSVTTNGDTVEHTWTDCSGGACTHTTMTAQAVALPPYYMAHNYPCPGGAVIIKGSDGAAVHSCAVTPVLTTIVPLTAAMVVGSSSQRAQITSSPVVLYRVSSEAVVYVTSYVPRGVYSETIRGRRYWVPGPAMPSEEVRDDIRLAGEMQSPTANATVLTYSIGKDFVYLTDDLPLNGIYSQMADGMNAWMAGVSKPTPDERDAIVTALIVHEQVGARALEKAVEAQKPAAAPPS